MGTSSAYSTYRPAARPNYFKCMGIFTASLTHPPRPSNNAEARTCTTIVLPSA